MDEQWDDAEWDPRPRCAEAPLYGRTLDWIQLLSLREFRRPTYKKALSLGHLKILIFEEGSTRPDPKGRRMTGSVGGVYGARRTVSLNIQENGGKVWKGGDTKVRAGRKMGGF